MVEKPAAGRRSHRKSRYGCQQCKSRKVKCDEGKPVCRNCKRHAISCSFSLLQHNTSSSQADTLNNSDTASPAPLSNYRVESTPELALADLELLHHFSTSTAYTFSQHPALQTLWRVNVPKVGFSAPYALRAILAISALHLAYLRPDKKQLYVSQAEYHHDAALKVVTPDMAGLMHENSDALFLFAILTCFISCAKPRKLDDFLLLDNGRISDWLTCFRGTRTIIDCTSDSLTVGPFSAIFKIRSRKFSSRMGRTEESETFLVNMQNIVREQINELDEAQVYLDAIDEMRPTIQLFFDATPGPWETDDVFAWLLRVSNEYLMRIREQQPLALILLGHFCVFFRRLEWMWWMEGWSIHLLSRIYALLDSEHRIWLQWPMEQLGWIP